MGEYLLTVLDTNTHVELLVTDRILFLTGESIDPVQTRSDYGRFIFLDNIISKGREMRFTLFG